MHLNLNWLTSVVAFYIFSALVQALPDPLPNERWYGAFYRFLQALGANWKLMIKQPSVMQVITTKVEETTVTPAPKKEEPPKS